MNVLKDKQDGQLNFSGSTQSCCFASLLWHRTRVARLCPGAVCAIGAKARRSWHTLGMAAAPSSSKACLVSLLSPHGPCCSIAQGAHQARLPLHLIHFSQPKKQSLILKILANLSLDVGEKSKNIMKKAGPCMLFHISDVKIKCFYREALWPERKAAEPALM